jgi:hypothetical protein
LDTLKNYQEIEALVARVEKNLAEGNGEGLLADLEALEPCTIYSGNELYERWERLKVPVVLGIYRTVPADRFVTITLSSYVLSKYEVFEALETVVDEVPLEVLLGLCERFESLPNDSAAPRLCDKILTSPEPSVTDWLQRWIDRLCEAEKAKGTDLDAHQQLVSSFRFSWSPLDGDLSRAVGLLARRQDQPSRALVERYLFSLPWGENRNATSELVASLRNPDQEANQVLLKRALEHYPTPSPLRLLLLGAYTQHDPTRAIELAFDDLFKVENAEEREAILGWLNDCQAESPTPRTRQLLQAAPWEAWPGVQRVALETVLASNFRDFPRPRPGSSDRAAMAVVRLFDRLRLNHTGCALTMPLLVSLAAFYSGLLNELLGSAGKAGYADFVSGGLLLLTLSFTSRTHFSGMETLADRFQMGLLLLFAMMLSFLCPVIVRLAF